MSDVADSLRLRVVERAGDACEYCLVPSGSGYYTHEVDHVVPRKHQGRSTLDNLAYACLPCNRHKGTDLSSIDPLTDEITELFNPRGHRWPEHFRLLGARIQPRTPIGRTTARLLHFNEPLRIEERKPFAIVGLLKPHA